MRPAGRRLADVAHTRISDRVSDLCGPGAGLDDRRCHRSVEGFHFELGHQNPLRRGLSDRPEWGDDHDRLLPVAGKGRLLRNELDLRAVRHRSGLDRVVRADGVFGGAADAGVRHPPGVGGGFSAIALTLVRDEAMAEFQKTLATLYKTQFNRTLDFIEFTPSQGAQVLVG